MQLISPNKNIKKRLEDNLFKESGYKSIVMKLLQIFLKKKKEKQMWLILLRVLTQDPRKSVNIVYIQAFIFMMAMVNNSVCCILSN